MTPPHADSAHILMTADTMGGVWTYSMDLCGELCRRGIQVSLATMGAPVQAWQRSQAKAIPGLTLYESEFPLEWMQDPWSGVDEAGDWLLNLRHRTSADLVHLNGYVHAALSWNVPVTVVAHSCVLSWWQAVKGESAPAEYDTYRQRVTSGIEAAHAVAAPSQWMLDQIRIFYDPLLRGEVIYNARSGEFHPDRKEYLVFGAGRIWDEAKNIGALCSVAPLLNWPVLVAGETTHPSGKQVTLSNVKLAGSLTHAQMKQTLSRAPIYVLPARYEPFGLSALEAALSGCALVLGRIDSLQEIWGNCAIFADPEDSAELLVAIRYLINNPERRQELGRLARARALQFSVESMVDSYLRLYRKAKVEFEQQAAQEIACVL